MITGALRTLSSCSLVLASSALAARAPCAQEVGFRGPATRGTHGSATVSKPQSKLWWHDGSWWGCLWSADAQSFTIHRLDAASETWTDTGTAADYRGESRADCLWNGAKLYIASNDYTAGAGGPGHPMRVYRYAYEPLTRAWSLDVGFPVEIGGSSTEALVIDQDSSGTLWAAWVAEKRVWFAHTLGDEREWSTPALHPQIGADLSGDDICALTRFGGDKLGLLWSDQVAGAFRFSFHVAGAADGAWSPAETVLSGPGLVDDHISLRATADGRVFAALKTSSDQILLAQRSSAGAWSGAAVASALDHWTRPLLVLDEEHRLVHVFATSPTLQGTIYEKTAPLDALGFSSGIGTPVLRDAGGPAYNDPTSTKQSVDGTTGLVVLASDLARQCYGHHHDDLGGATPSVPVAAFGAGTQRGIAPLGVQFIDDSRGAPSAWAWTFGDGANSTQRNPRHVYTGTGNFTVSLRVTNALGTNLLTRTALVHVEPQPLTLVLHPSADGQVHEAAPGSNYGGLVELRVRDATDDYHSYLRFFVPPGSGLVQSAHLRLACTDGSPDGGSLFPVSSEWNESELTWARAPRLDGAPLASLGSVTAGTVVDQDLGAFVGGGGSVALALVNASTNSAFYSSREGPASPELVLGLSAYPPIPPVARFEALRTHAPAPFLVQFVDTSDGPVNTRAWDFGDGSSSNLRTPAHLYTQPGSYSVRLTVTSANGSNTLTLSDYVVVLRDDGPRHEGPVGPVLLGDHRAWPPIGERSGTARAAGVACTTSTSFAK